MSVTPVQSVGAAGSVKSASRQPRHEDFAAIFAGYTGAMIANGPTAVADPRDTIAKQTTARSERIEGEVAEMRQAELERPSAADRDATGDDARFDADALRRQARLESSNSVAGGASANLRQSHPGQPPQSVQDVAANPETGKSAIESALRSDSTGDDHGKVAERSGSTESATKSPSPGADSARTHGVATPTRPANQPVAVTATQGDASRTDAARSIARMLARDFGGAAGRDPSLQPVAVNRDPQPGNQPRSTQADGAAGKPDTPGRTDEENSARRTEFAKLMRNIRLNVGQKQSSATIQMNPPQLGRLKIDVRMTDQRLSVQVETQTPQGRALMTERAGELIDALRASGIEVEQFEITAAVQRDGLITAKADTPRETNDGAPPSKRINRRDGESGDDRDDTQTRNEGHDRGGLSLRA